MATSCDYNPTCSLLVRFIFMFLFSSSYLDTIKLCLGDRNLSVKCMEAEREALLAFKEDLTDPSGRLSSWIGKDCCKWRGVGCSDQIGHVIMLNLTNPIQLTDDDWTEEKSLAQEKSRLGGKINPSLLHLKYLNYLDLSYNDFQSLQIPKFFGMFKNLRYLNLSSSSFAGEIPPQLGNLSNLQYLDLQSSWDSHSNNLHWLSGLSSLKYLNLGGVNLTSVGTDWLQAINMLPSLVELHLSKCLLENLPLSLPLVNFTSLVTLDLSENYFNSSLPQWLFNLTSLTELLLNENSFRGSIPRLLGNFSNLRNLNLFLNKFDGEIHEFLSSFSCFPNSSLVSLNLGGNEFVGKLPESLGQLKNLQYLDLSGNSFWGSIPASLGNLSSLKALDLSSNEMNGTIPESFGQLSELIDVNLERNSWEGILTDAHLANLTRLENMIFAADTNKSLVFNVTYDWVPPFRLKRLDLENCHVGPRFPIWLQVQNGLTEVNLVNVGISDIIPEEWFSNSCSQIRYMFLSNNQISGKLPHQLEFPKLDVIDLSYNRFEGPLPLWSANVTRLYLQHNLFSGSIPLNIGELMPKLRYLYLSENRLNGRIPPTIWNSESFEVLSLRSNQFAGEIPQILSNLSSIWVVDLANNNLSGSIPSSISFLRYLSILMLSNNNLDGEIPFSLQNCTQLMSLDLRGNKFSGNLPSWIGESTSQLGMLLLRSNLFNGNIPWKICNLQILHILDLSHNKFSGAIPNCLGNLTALVYGNSSDAYSQLTRGYKYEYIEQTVVVAKGRELEYSNTLVYVNSIDLSGNYLTGEIPEEIASLSMLATLNLSINHLSGRIPEKLGNLRWLETLDLSQNNLSGSIPQSLSSLTFLAHLNLSYNDLNGRIPSGNELQTLNDASIYEGNPSLCGDPLPTKCTGDDSSNGPTSKGGGGGIKDEENGKDSEMPWFFVSIALGFVVGFWGVYGTLVIKKSWRHAYFQFIDYIKDMIALWIALKVVHLRRKIGFEKN